MTKNKKIIISFLSVISVAIIGSVFVNLGTDWFNQLNKPSQWISNAIIPVMWTIIYTITAIILYKWFKNDDMPKTTIWLFIVNGILNVLWCLIYFALNSLLGGLIVILLNLIASVLLIREICKTSELYSYILTIYPTWLGFATCLNLALWILN